MLVDSVDYPTSLHDVARAATESEATGYDTHWVGETAFDPFIAATVASIKTHVVGLGTNIAVAFARNPMTVATSANDVHQFSGGRFILGLGTQVKPHITRRFSMPWSQPVARMREFVQATRGIWATWNKGAPLNFVGEFYQHTLTNPLFTPAPNPYGSPPIYLAGVGVGMTEVAGEVADGFLCHAFTTAKYLREVTVPALIRGRDKVGLNIDGFTVSGPCFVVVVGDTDADVADSIMQVKRQIAFYGSTPSYRPVLETHGWGELADELHRLSVAKRWDALGDVIDDEVLHTFAVVGAVESVAGQLATRFGTLLNRITLKVYGNVDLTQRAEIVRALHTT